MDQVKIGKYIAGKRKERGYTQVQLADRLGMSDKSVSKWERGVCLPDVSVYADLCQALGISLNEFFAGEDLTMENIPTQSEQNIISVARFGKARRNRLRRIVAILLAALVLLGAGFLWFLKAEGYLMENYIAPYDSDSPERSLAGMLAGSEGLYLSQYGVDSSYRYMQIEAVTYRDGRETDRCHLGNPLDETNRKGTIALLPDSVHDTLKMVVSASKYKAALDGDFTYWTEESGFGFIGKELEKSVTVHPDEPQVVAALYFDRGDIRPVPLREIEENPGEALADLDLCVYFTVTFLTEVPQ